MGCDYYIIKYLEITLRNSDIRLIEVERERGYIFNVPSDAEEDEYEKIKEEHLKVEYKPKVLYLEGKWKSVGIKNKYEKYLENLNLDEIVSIFKIESKENR